MKRLLSLVLLLTLLTQSPALAAEGGNRGGGSLDDEGLHTWLESTEPGSSPSRSRGGPAATWVEITYREVHRSECFDGIARVITRHFRDGSPSVVLDISCPTAPLPPGVAVPPPTVEQVHDAVDLPTSAAAVNPRVRGLVGLETWFWYEGPGTATVEVSLNGGTVVAEARTVAYEFTTGDGAAYTSDHPGTEDDPAARHVYQQHGTYDITVTVIWQGSFTFTAPDGTSITGDLGTVRTSNTRAYEVVESQAVRSR